MTSYVSQAIAVATTAHAGQVDKVGEPYIRHPAPVLISTPAVKP